MMMKTAVKNIGILGLGRVGRSITDYLLGKDVRLSLFDENPQAYLHKSIKLVLESNLAQRIDSPRALTDADLVIKSPGIPEDAEWIKEIDAAGVEMIDEVEFTWRELGRPLTVAVTGTNGKSTTTAWTAEVLKAGGLSAFCGGNLAPGRPFSEALSERPYDVYVVEVSSFQLERCPDFKPHVGVLLNVTADHLNRHSAEEYLELKLSLFKNHTSGDYSILNADDRQTTANISSIPGRHIFFSVKKKDADFYYDNEGLYSGGGRIINRSQLLLPGMHNVANALAASAVASSLGIETGKIAWGLQRFSGLPHRMQYLGKLDQRPVFNNSMCTNPEAFYHSVHAFDDSSVIIAGGTEKGLPLDAFIAGVRERAKFLVLFGENAGKLADILEREDFSSCVIVDSLRAALQAALENSRPGERILFSPGFASFGNFKNFEERGHAFIKAYRRISARR
ncbi:UDP-N-acetylmuramoyl-L-alanine--D-glutamate ligase [candidate division WOR-3 bacterium]|uniref:UDP-N-acetylmuramoylalanine--D-glutamate ligase n=1 Tax=candidate division WOR-3 bacterium TaxID=2052148 RepID=A0A9D5QDB0_UNCW3|nr:UDP-N-acetylmuramoyl-L-alanine--D-glutamate ligase [candidate division WOR-3 bacterium]MBD3364871.1 UDP-N-acetylmuramoyl-L-alanine--D-glutamate ligase [candidate division WOR-3 bacterium]